MPTFAVCGPARWFVLDDGAGGGIEGGGTVRLPGWGNMAAFWYDFSPR